VFLNCKNAMAQIGFTHKTEPVYTRFQDMRRAYEDAHGRTYAPDFLTALMDEWNVLKKCEELNRAEQENPTSSGSHMGLEVTYCVKHLNGKPIIYKVEEWEREGSTWEPVNENE
jgi:hypothetical protein